MGLKNGVVYSPNLEGGQEKSIRLGFRHSLREGYILVLWVGL